QFVPLPPGTPPAPANVSVTTITNTTLTWYFPDAGLCTYNVKYSATHGGPYTTLASGILGTYYITSVAPTNYFVVSAVRGGMASGYSAEFGGPPLPPQNGTYKFIDVPGYVLDSPGGGGAGTGVDQQSYSGTNQQWVVTLVTNNQYEITSVANGLALS